MTKLPPVPQSAEAPDPSGDLMPYGLARWLALGDLALKKETKRQLRKARVKQDAAVHQTQPQGSERSRSAKKRKAA